LKTDTFTQTYLLFDHISKKYCKSFIRTTFPEHLHKDVEASFAALNAQKDQSQQEFKKIFSTSNNLDKGY